MSRLSVRSEDRIEGSAGSHDFIVNYENPITVTKLRLVNATFDNIIHNITEDNNQFNWTRGAGSYSVTIEPGLYDPTGLQDELMNQMNIAHPGNNYQVSYNPNTIKFLITCDTAIRIDAGSMNLLLGYLPDGSSWNSSYHASLHTARINRPLSVLIKIKEFGNPVRVSNGDAGTFLLMLNVDNQSLIDQAGLHYQTVDFGHPTTIDRLNISVWDDGKPLRMNDAEFELFIVGE